jgi:hypothetical protein
VGQKITDSGINPKDNVTQKNSTIDALPPMISIIILIADLDVVMRIALAIVLLELRCNVA